MSFCFVLQQLGRTHRSNEVTGVLYALVISSLGGERRFASACAARLQSLGALTKGDRRAATGSNLAQYDVDTDYGRKALRAMVQAIWKYSTALPAQALLNLQAAGMNVRPDEAEEKKNRELENALLLKPLDPQQLKAHMSYIPHPEPWSPANAPMFIQCLESLGFHQADIEKKMTVKTFLNRILGLPVQKQNALFEVRNEREHSTHKGDILADMFAQLSRFSSRAFSSIL